VVITTTRVDTIVAPNTNVTKRRVIITFAVNLGRGLGGFLMERSLSRSLRLPTMNTRIVETPNTVFTNPIMTTHVHKTIDQPTMSSIVARGYISTNVEAPKGRHRKPFVIT
jgi:hypothetical protein